MSKLICYTFNEYQNKYPELLKNYLDEYIDNTDLLFWNEQKDFYNECLKNVTLEKTNKGFDKLKAPFEPLSISIEEIHYTINESMSVVDNKNVKHSVTNENKVKYDNAFKSFSKILEFIQNQISEITKLKDNTIIEIVTKIDLSNSNAVEKIIYLNELGIIDFLRTKQPFNTSVNSLANVLTAITSEKHTTIQPYLNALLSNTGAENKNPYYTKSTVEKVKNQLMNLGVKPK